MPPPMTKLLFQLHAAADRRHGLAFRGRRHQLPLRHAACLVLCLLVLATTLALGLSLHRAATYDAAAASSSPR
jgi:hypothetical protein